MKVAIIGGAGFVGTNLANLLKKKKYDFNIFDIKKSFAHNKNSCIGNICSIGDLNSITDCETLINLAAVHRDDIEPKSLYDLVNVKGSKNICNIARKKGINKIIFTSSVAIYGFAEPNTDEEGEINYFNDYGRTKFLAEKEYLDWYNEDTVNRTLIIVRPTVIFGEGNRGNVFNLLNQIKSRRFVMFGNGKNIKSMAYVQNVVAFLEHSMHFKPGLHIYNYIDKPDINMNKLVSITRNILFKKGGVGLRFPASLGITIGYLADLLSRILSTNLPISSIRVKKFLSTTQFSSAVKNTNFNAPYTLEEGLKRTLKYEFLEKNDNNQVFETE